MTIQIKTSIKRDAFVSASCDTVYLLLKDVGNSNRLFPKVNTIRDEGNGCFAWTLEPMGTHTYQHRVKYVSQWTFDDEQHRIIWRPTQHDGNADIAGAWSIQSSPGGTQVMLEIKAELELDLPRWMKVIAEPIVQSEFLGLLNTYFDNVVQHCQTQAPR